MRHILVSLFVLFALPVHAELDFDKWHFAELVVSGLKYAGQGNFEPMNKTLETLRIQLAKLNIEINHLNPNDREAGVSMARDLLTQPIYEAWETEQIVNQIESQRQFLARVFDLGLSESIEKTTAELKRKASNGPENLRLKNHLTLAGVTTTVFGTSIYVAHAIHDPGPAFLGTIASLGGYVVGMLAFSSYNAYADHLYKTNFISPIFRECELGLLRRSAKNPEDVREEKGPSCDV